MLEGADCLIFSSMSGDWINELREESLCSFPSRSTSFAIPYSPVAALVKFSDPWARSGERFFLLREHEFGIFSSSSTNFGEGPFLPNLRFSFLLSTLLSCEGHFS